MVIELDRHVRVGGDRQRIRVEGDVHKRNRLRVRLLTSGADLSPQERAIYLQRVEELVGQIATLQHPNILPLVDYGTYRGLPYLVYPNPPLRSLSARLAQSGPLDPVAAGRYLDQVARALEYAIERGTLHLALSTDCVYLQLDGQPVVADFGVRRMIEMAEREGSGNAAAWSSTWRTTPQARASSAWPCRRSPPPRVTSPPSRRR